MGSWSFFIFFFTHPKKRKSSFSGSPYLSLYRFPEISKPFYSNKQLVQVATLWNIILHRQQMVLPVLRKWFY